MCAMFLFTHHNRVNKMLHIRAIHVFPFSMAHCGHVLNNLLDRYEPGLAIIYSVM